MINVLHIIPVLSNGGAARALIALAKYSSLQSSFRHRAISLRPADPEAIDLARIAGLPVLQAADPATVIDEIAAADVVHVDWWNDPDLQMLLHRRLPPLRLLFWYHVAGNSAPQIITDDLVNFADLNVATNPWSYRELTVFRNMPPTERDQRVAMVIDGADFDRLQDFESKPHAHFNVGYIGTVDFVKMHPRYVSMSSAISIPEARFIVCGHGNVSRLREEALALGTAERFDFRGYVSDIKPVIESLDVYGYPLCEDTYASGELNLQEVMYAGIPPVVFPHGGVKGLVEHDKTGLVVTDEEEYRQAIEFLYHRPEERARLGRGAREHAREHFGADNAARLLNPLYERLMSNPKRARAWECRLGQPNLGQPLSLLDVVDVPTGARMFIESLGAAGKPFLTSLTTSDLMDLGAAEQAIAHASPLLRSAGSGGILHYRNAFLNDAYLRLWSGLVLAQEGKSAQAIIEFQRAIDLGCNHWRVGWYIDQASRQVTGLPLEHRTTPAFDFGGDTNDRNPDDAGRHWFQVPAASPNGTGVPNQFDHWVFDPSLRQLYKATTGEWPVETVITAASLGLDPEAEAIGKDPFGRYWFRLPEGEKRVYHAGERRLYRVIPGAEGAPTLVEDREWRKR